MLKNYTLLIAVLALLLSFSSCSSSKKSSSKSNSSKSKSSSKSKAPSKSNSSTAYKAIKTAKSYTGTKYKYGGMSKKGIDCSGLMYVSYQEAGVTLPRTSNEQSKVGKRIYIGELQKGDLVFFGAKPGSKKITHVGMITYSSKASIKFIHASSSRGVVESELLSKYYKPRYIKAVRPAN